MADELKSAAADSSTEDKSELVPEDKEEHSEVASPKSDQKTRKTEVSPDVSTYSNTSRYGRARKPKITEDFYNIEDIFGPYERITSSSPRRKPHKLELSPSKSPSKQESIDLTETQDEEVSKVMKLVSNNDFSPKSPPYPPKSVKVKTYSNKHKKILESHVYKVNGAKFKCDGAKCEPKGSPKSEFKSVLFSDNSNDSNDFFDSPRKSNRTKTKLSDVSSQVSSIRRDFDTTDEDFSEDFAKLAKNNKKINKLQKDLNITEFKTGRLRSSIADRSWTEDEFEAEHEQAETEHEQAVDAEPAQKEAEPVKEQTKLQIAEELDEESHTYAPEVGELAWSRVGTYPFWPSIVTNEPGFDRHSRIVMFGRKNVRCYHVNFFGDNGRRSWVLATHIFPFNRRSDLEIMAQNVSKDSKPKDPKHLSAFIINPNKLKKWETAVTEAESITDFSAEIRIEKFFEMVSPKKKSLKRPLLSPKSGKVDMPHKKIKLEKKKQIKKTKKTKKQTKNRSDEENISKSPSPSIKEETVEDKPVKNKIKNPKNKLEPDKTEKKKTKPSDEPKSDESSSESDLVQIKEETRDTPSPYPQLSSIQRQKRVNLFRGITKERVCQICGKNKQVYKCKGNCFGLYHIECDKKVRLKVLSRLSEEKSSISDDSDEDLKKAKNEDKNNRRNSNTSDKSHKSEVKIEDKNDSCRKGVSVILEDIFDKVFDAINKKKMGQHLESIKIEENSENEYCSTINEEYATVIKQEDGSNNEDDDRVKNEDGSCQNTLDASSKNEDSCNTTKIGVEDTLNNLSKSKIGETSRISASSTNDEKIVDNSTSSNSSGNDEHTIENSKSVKTTSKNATNSKSADSSSKNQEETTNTAVEPFKKEEKPFKTAENATKITSKKDNDTKLENSPQCASTASDNIATSIDNALNAAEPSKMDENSSKAADNASKTAETSTDLSSNTVEASSARPSTKNTNSSSNEDTSSANSETSSKTDGKESKTEDGQSNTGQPSRNGEGLSENEETLSKNCETAKNQEDGSKNVGDVSKKEEMSSKTEDPSPTTHQSSNQGSTSQSIKRSLSLAEQIDLKMAEVMQSLITETKYTDSTTDEGSENEDSIVIDPFKSDTVLEEYSHLPALEDDKKIKKIIKHVTADGIFDIIEEEEVNNEDFRCAYCCTGVRQPCFICNKDVSKSGDGKRHKCFTAQCGKYYHSECLKDWPQTKWNVSSKSKKIENETLSCPYHNCHTCISDNPRGPLSRYTNEKLAKCIRCPTTYHSNNFCIPAGTEILSTYQLICPKHLQPTEEEELSSSPNSRKSVDTKRPEVKKSSKSKIMPHMNASWCFICSMGGSLICCETCPSAFHVECLKLVPPEGKYLCEECESGRLPLYDEIVWVKLGAYRWWPAQILYPADVPPNVASIPHTIGEFVVRFFGSHDHYWVNRGRVFLFQEGDTGHASSKKSAVDGLFVKAIEEATRAHKIFIDERAYRAAEAQNGMKPPAYIKIKVNRPVGNVRTNDADTSNTTPCDCDPSWEEPCGPDSDCLNRILMTECNPMVCAAGSRCCNQSFEKRLYAPVAPFKTTGRGWGLKTLAPVRKGSFVIEYVGEVIDEIEYRRRMKRKHEQKDENYYFLTIDKDRMIDAGPKGNVARFMNHSCSPNCETQKWTINGDTRVGLFAITDIPTDAELTFNYNLECIGEEKKECRCGAPNCSGFIGVKAKQDEVTKKRKSVPLKSKKKKSLVPEVKLTEVITCFVCGEPDAIQSCDREACNKFYHLQCVSLENYQEGKWLCPWHSCSICTKRTTRCCYMCINSYCPLHSEGNIRYERNKGFVCTIHDIKTEEDPKDAETPSEDPKTKEKIKKTKKQPRSSTDSNKIVEDEPKEPIEETKSSSGGSSRRSSKSDEVETKIKDIEVKDEVIKETRKSGKISKISEETFVNDDLSPKSKKEITIQNGAIIGEISKHEEMDCNTSSDEIIQIDILVSTKTQNNNINSSIKKRKSRLSLKKSLETSSTSSQDDLSDDEKPLVTLKKIKLSDEAFKPKLLRSSSQEDLRKSSDDTKSQKASQKRSSSLDLESSSSESDFIVKKIVKKKSVKRNEDNTEPKKLRSSINKDNEDRFNKSKEEIERKSESIPEKKTSPKVKLLKDLPKIKKMLTSTPKPVENKLKKPKPTSDESTKSSNLQTPKKDLQEDPKPSKTKSTSKKLSVKKLDTPKNSSLKPKSKPGPTKPEIRRLTRNLKNSMSDEELEYLSSCSSIEEMEISAEDVTESDVKQSEDVTRNDDTESEFVVRDVTDVKNIKQIEVKKGDAKKSDHKKGGDRIKQSDVGKSDVTQNEDLNKSKVAKVVKKRKQKSNTTVRKSLRSTKLESEGTKMLIEDTKEDAIKEIDIKEESITEVDIKEEGITEESMKDSIKEDDMKVEDIKEENKEDETKPEETLKRKRGRPRKYPRLVDSTPQNEENEAVTVKNNTPTLKTNPSLKNNILSSKNNTPSAKNNTSSAKNSISGTKNAVRNPLSLKKESDTSKNTSLSLKNDPVSNASPIFTDSPSLAQNTPLSPEIPSETTESATESTPVVKRPIGRPRKHPLDLKKNETSKKSEKRIETKKSETKKTPKKIETPKRLEAPKKTETPKKLETKKPETKKFDVKPETTEIFKKLPDPPLPKHFENHVKEVKLTANVPERHLRVVLRKNEIDQKIDNKFLKMQNDIERDLPIRKRSKLRYEAQL